MTQTVLPMTTATGFGPLPEILADASGAPAVGRTFRRAGLPEALIHDRRMRLPLEAMVGLFAQGAEIAGDRLLGLRVGQAMNPGAYGLWIEHAMEAGTLRSAIRRLSWGVGLHQSGSEVLLTRLRGRWIFGYRVQRFANVDPRAHIDHVVPSMLKIVRRFAGAAWRPGWVGLPYAGDPGAGALAQAIGAEVRFACPYLMIPVSSAVLDRARPVGPAAHDARPLTRSDVVAHAGVRPFHAVTAVEDCIQLELLAGRCGVETVAQRLGLSTRSLQRTLSQEGTSFSDILDRIRRVKAAELLASPDMRVGSVALALGYSDPSNFTRAYKRWTGTAPTVT